MTVAPELKRKRARRKARRRLNRQQQRRRMLLRSGITGFALLLLQPLAHLPLVRRARARLRPPGALAELDFLGACIKCGQCVQVCPVRAITFAGLGEGFGTAAPFIEARSQACDFSCDALSCILACPTGALAHDTRTKEEVRCGVARLARPDTCLARAGRGFRGTARGPEYRGRLRYEEVDRWNPLPVAEHAYNRDICDLCVLECPIGESALRLEALADAGDAGDAGGPGDPTASTAATERDRLSALVAGIGDPAARTPVVGDACVGCGVCEMVCPEEPPCIVIDPRGAQEAGS